MQAVIRHCKKEILNVTFRLHEMFGELTISSCIYHKAFPVAGVSKYLQYM